MNEFKGFPVERILTHIGPHADEDAAIWLLKKFGEPIFPGISKARIEYWGKPGLPEGLRPDQHAKNGTLPVGLGGGPLDEHATSLNGNAVKSEDCAMTLVAKALGVQDDPALKPILSYVLNADKSPATHPFDIATMAKEMNLIYPDRPDLVMAWATAAFEAKYQNNLRRQEAWKVINNAKVETVAGPTERPYSLMVIESDNAYSSALARSKTGGMIDIVIQKNSKGNVAINASTYSGTKLFDVAKLIRVEEQRAKGLGDQELGLVTSNWRDLSAVGSVPGAENWYFTEQLNGLLNGSHSRPDAKPTLIPLKRIVELGRLGINIRQFEPSRASKCQAGICTSTRSNPCPLFEYRLHRCHLVQNSAGPGRIA